MTSREDVLSQPAKPSLRGPLVIQWRNRLTYLVMSLVVGWHSFAIVVAPAPENSPMVRSLYLLLQPYLSIFRLGSQWGFFAPDVGKHALFRYVVEDAAGKQHTFEPTEESTWSIPRYVMWREFKYFFDTVMEAPEAHAQATAALLCRKHASLDPLSVSLLRVQELDFWPEHHLQGHRTLDPDFVTVNTFARVKCRDGSPPPRRSPIRPVRPR